MATELTLPRLGQGMESGTIVRWLKSEGDKVEKGEPLYELDTEKVTQEVEADASGVLLKIFAGEGDEVPVGKRVAVIGEPGEELPDEPSPDGAAAAEREAAEAEPEPKAREEPAPAPEAAPPSARGPGERIKASPLARRIARERGIDLAAVTGTGPEGRIVAEDVERAEAAPAPAAAPAVAAAPGEIEVEKLSTMRRTIARRLTEAWQAPVFQLGRAVDASHMLELRERLVERRREDEPKPTVSDVLTRLCAAALVRHRALNAQLLGEEIHRFPAAHVGLAVAIPDGLVVPVVRDADRKSVMQIAADRADLVERARGGKLRQEDMEGGTFTISNLGMYPIDRFVAVLNPPQVAILAVGAAEERPVIDEGDLVIRPTVEFTLTCDHRAVDGATAAEFLQTLCAFVEEPALAL